MTIRMVQTKDETVEDVLKHIVNYYLEECINKEEDINLPVLESNVSFFTRVLFSYVNDKEFRKALDAHLVVSKAYYTNGQWMLGFYRDAICDFENPVIDECRKGLC